MPLGPGVSWPASPIRFVVAEKTYLPAALMGTRRPGIWNTAPPAPGANPLSVVAAPAGSKSAGAMAGPKADRDKARDVFARLRQALSAGTVRAAEADATAPTGWRVNTWVKQGILLGFRFGETIDVSADHGKWPFYDKDTMPLKKPGVDAGVRIVPGGSTIREGAFVAKSVEFLRNGVHLLIVDLFPPTPRDPAGIHQAIWEQLTDEPFEPRPADKPLTVASYEAGDELTAYVDPVAVGDALPEPPLFLAPGWYVGVPLESTYNAAWDVTPRPIRDLVEPPSPGDRSGAPT